MGRWKDRWSLDRDRTIKKERIPAKEEYKKTDETKMTDEELLKSAWHEYYKVKNRK